MVAGLMTRHNLAVHISWLLSSEVTPPVNIHTVPTAPTANSDPAIATVCIESEGEDTEETIPSPIPSPSPRHRTVRTLDVAPDFQRPPLPDKITPKPPLRETQGNIVDESMAQGTSVSKSARSGPVNQAQLATPTSTTGSTFSLTQGYSAFLRAKNGALQNPLIEQ